MSASERMIINQIEGSNRFPFGAWDIFGLFGSSALLCAVSLLLAIGPYWIATYYGYFRHPLIFLMNWLPTLIVQALLLMVFNRQWLAFLGNCIFTMIPAVGNFYKWQLRNEPFQFSDFSSIGAGLEVAGDYNLSFNPRIGVAVFFVLAGTICMAWLFHGRLEKKKRLIWFAILCISLWPTWKLLYADDDLYMKIVEKNRGDITFDQRDYYLAGGFPFPFLNSIGKSTDIPPQDYNEAATEEDFKTFSGLDIPEQRKVNILCIQLESFCDLEQMGISEINRAVYAPLRDIQEKSIAGILIPNVIGGGTVNTERCFLAGTCEQMEYNRDAFSYIRYLESQGYYCTGSHPYVQRFYSRGNINRYLGFRDYLYIDNYFTDYAVGDWENDAKYLPELFRIFLDHISDGKTVFSFNVSTQGHSPYNEEGFDKAENESLWPGEGVSEATRYIVSNYLGLVAETQKILRDELFALEERSEPIVVLLYGDHKPWFGDSAYKEMGIQLEMSSEEKMIQYLGTPYMIWANQAAKAILSDNFTGVAPTVSPCFMMNVLFQRLGWKGPAFMQFTDTVMERIPVLNEKEAYMENGVFTNRLSETGLAIMKHYQNMQYYVRYRPELASK